jgi:CheY-like chemotaxis protein
MILFIDDEKRFVDTYILELEECGHHVLYTPSVDDAWILLQKNENNLDLLIIDMMMPPGTLFKNVDTIDGLRTGLHFYRRVREKLPECPVIILKNISDERIFNDFSKEKKCWFIQKSLCLPFELAEEVKRILEFNESDQTDYV